jgi:pyrroloquinoline quinone (PQQ) biosynthesis protein C
MSDQPPPSHGSSLFLQAPPCDARPALCFGVSVSTVGSQNLLVTDDLEICVHGLPNFTAHQVVSRFNGRETAASIAGAAGIPVAKVIAVVAGLMEAGVVVDLRSGIDSNLTSDAFILICRRLFATWKMRLFGHRLWRALNSGEATPSQFLGWLLESYHFAEGVNVRLPLAIAQCRHREIRELLAQHYAEEYGHEGFFLSALTELGVGPEIVASARPLPGTQAILNHMRDCARRDPLHYAVCGGFLEATGTDRATGRAFFANLGRHYAPQNPKAIQPLVDHAALDEVYGHSGLLAEICRCISQFSWERASSALGSCALFVETLELWSTDILTTYAQPAFAPDANPRRYRRTVTSRGPGTSD